MAADHEHRRRLVDEARDTLHFVHAVGAVDAQFRTHFQIGRVHGEAAVLRVHDQAGHVVAEAALKSLGLPVLQKEIHAPVQWLEHGASFQAPEPLERRRPNAAQRVPIQLLRLVIFPT